MGRLSRNNDITLSLQYQNAPSADTGRRREPYTVIESTNEVVRSWAHEVIDDHREDAERLDTTAFTHNGSKV